MPPLVENPEPAPPLPSPADRRQKRGGGLLRLLKLLPPLSSGCKKAALLGRPRKPVLSKSVVTGTLFGHRRGRVSLAIQEDPRQPPVFAAELPLLTHALLKEMASGLVRIALESEAAGRSHRKKLLDEPVWGIYFNGRKIGYSTRRKQPPKEELRVVELLRGVSMGAGVLPAAVAETEEKDGELTYMRARFQRVVGSRDSEAMYIVNPDGTGGPELSIFFVRVH